LHWHLTQSPPLTANKKLDRNPRSDRDKWFLPHYIEVAAELPLIANETAITARLCANYRNLIHPGRVARLGQVCDRGTAFSAVGALEHIVRDLASNRSL
jgi:hypothetical protein